VAYRDSFLSSIAIYPYFTTVPVSGFAFSVSHGCNEGGFREDWILSNRKQRIKKHMVAASCMDGEYDECDM